MTTPTLSLPLVRFCGALVAGVVLFTSPVGAVDSKAARKLFANPPREYASAPLWVWNDLLTEQQIRHTLRDLAGQKVKQVFVHPRPGLMTPYLSADWFRLWKVALDEAGRLDMNVWIYDENSYPSGFAGGWVPELMPESRGMGLHFRAAKSPPKGDANVVAVFRIAGAEAANVTPKVQAGEALPEGSYLVAEVRRAGNSPWHGNRSYVNLLTPGVTEKFLNVTLDAYKRELGRHFGKRVPGSFTDEPEIRPAGGLPWCADLPEQFQKRWGYSLLDSLPSFTRETGDWRKVRHNFYSTLNDLFIERWAKPYYEWCGKNGLQFTGHYWDHEWPNCVGVPDNMAMAAWQQTPGIDCLMNQYAEHTHAQFGNARMVKELASVANQLGCQRRLCEIYGAGGWDLRFEDMKRIADWLGVLGVNLFDEHLSYVTLRGARKRDHPQSFSYHEPWWDSFHVVGGYLTRLSYALSQGEQINRVLVLEPTTTAWMYQGNAAELKELGDAFFSLLMALEAAQVEYDLADENIMSRLAQAPSKPGPEHTLTVGRRSYSVVVVPGSAENLDRRTLELLGTFLKLGGTVFATGDPPKYADGNASDMGKQLAALAGWRSTSSQTLIPALAKATEPERFVIERAPQDKGILFHQRRHLEDGQILFLVNTSIESPSAGAVESDLQGIEQWDLFTGESRPYPFQKTPKGVRASFQLPLSGSLLLFLSKKAIKPAPASIEIVTTLPATGPAKVGRLEPNVLTLDYVDVTARGETRSNVYFYQANQFAWQKNGMERNPWDSAVQFKDELIAKKFQPGSGFTASYRFTVEGAVPENLAIVIERPDLYTITCNGQPVAAEVKKRIQPGGPNHSPAAPVGGYEIEFRDWWLDKAFGKIDLASAAKTGENLVTLQATPFTIFHELEPAYLLGDFTLKPASKGFVVAADAPLNLSKSNGDLAHQVNPDGTMWLTGGFGFAEGVNDRTPFIVFDLGQPVDLSAIKIWNYNEAHVRDLTGRGANRVRIQTCAQADFDASAKNLGAFQLAKATGTTSGQTLPVAATGVRFVRIDILSNHHGVSYPPSGEVEDNAFVGLAEVQFIDARGARVSGVKVARVSSELATHRRLAKHVVDGSGLIGARPGWNEQGHPFYAAGVAYRQQFKIDKLSGDYRVRLPDWYGSVAKVTVNGKPAGHIAAPPWECDVAEQLKRGDNTIEVVVIGTLKNTLGPHHGNHALGSAWPGMFQNGPKDGPPPGQQYATVGYGLFEPFELRQIVKR